MRLTGEMIQELLDTLDEIREKVFKGRKAEYPFSEWERKRKLVRQRLRKLPELVELAAGFLDQKRGPGRPRKADVVKQTMLLLFARLMNKSNRDVENLLVLFRPLFGFDASYKSVERLYSDEEVKLVLHNLFVLLLNGKTSGRLAGDGTGYSLTITKRYASNPKKRGRSYRYVFRTVDLETGMYVGFGYSKKSEMEAFHRAMAMLKELGVEVNEISLDKYYSSRKVLRLFGEKTSVYVIPKRNLSRANLEWVPVLHRIIEDPKGFLEKYFTRNLAEAAISADKRRFGWVIRQRREDRIEIATFATTLLHNVFITRGVTS